MYGCGWFYNAKVFVVRPMHGCGRCHLMEVSFTIESNIAPALASLSRSVKDLTPVFGDFGEYMVRRTRDRFDRQIAPSGKPWVTLAEATIKAKQRRAATGKPYRTRATPTAILKDTFNLRDSITYRAGADWCSIGTDLGYGIYHQSTDPRTIIPYRPFLGMDESDRAELEYLLAEHFSQSG